MGTETVLYTYDYPLNTSTIDEYLFLASASNRYMVSVDKPNANVAITRINLGYTYPNYYFNSASTNLYSLAGQIQSACYYN